MTLQILNQEQECVAINLALSLAREAYSKYACMGLVKAFEGANAEPMLAFWRMCNDTTRRALIAYCFYKS